MKKISLIFISLLALLSFVFSSCKKNKDDLDVLEGTWKSEFPNASAADRTIITIVFDGKGKYTYTSVDIDGFIWYSGKGSYSIESNNTIVRTHGTTIDSFGNTKDSDGEYALDLNSTPPTLSGDAYDSSGTFMMTMVFVKQ